MAYQDFIKVGKYYRFSLFLYSFKKRTLLPFRKNDSTFLPKSTIVLGKKYYRFAQKVLSFFSESL